jgi:hypothetical protein
MKPECETCRFWDFSRLNEDGRGLCRRRSPEIGDGGIAIWAMSLPSDWCGAWSELKFDVHGEPERRGRKPVFDEVIMDVMREHAATSDMALGYAEAERLVNAKGMKVSSSTFCRALRRLAANGELTKTGQKYHAAATS